MSEIRDLAYILNHPDNGKWWEGEFQAHGAPVKLTATSDQWVKIGISSDYVWDSISLRKLGKAMLRIAKELE